MTGPIRHSAAFRLIHPAGSEAEREFLTANAALGSIAGVEDFAVLRDVSEKNPYSFVVTMTFADQSAYDAYNEHPDHVRFVDERWIPEVAEFIELDWVSQPLT